MAVGHEFWLSAFCLLGFAINCVGVPETSPQSAKDNVPQVVALAGARIDPSGYKMDFFTSRNQDLKDLVVEFRICILELKDVSRVSRDGKLAIEISTDKQQTFYFWYVECLCYGA